MDKKPKYLLMENVKNLITDFSDDFQSLKFELEKLGYYNLVLVMNSKNYGIPQNRERVFMISSKNLDQLYKYKLPEHLELKTTLQDLLQSINEIDNYYYLNPKNWKVAFGYVEKFQISEWEYVNKKISNCLLTKDPKSLRISTTLIIYEKDRNEQLLLLQIKNNGYSLFPIEIDHTQFRVLTEKECWRLMGFEDSDFEKASKVVSRRQLYKQAGNSIVVPVLEAIFKELFKNEIIK